jgi:hypothetical protein
MRNYHSSKIDLVTRRHFGGGMFKTQSYTPPPMPKFEMPKMPKMPDMPAMPEAPAPPPPPPEQTNMSVADGQMAALQEEARRDGYRRTVMAGDTGGYSNPVTGQSLLG